MAENQINVIFYESSIFFNFFQNFLNQVIILEYHLIKRIVFVEDNIKMDTQGLTFSIAGDGKLKLQHQ